MRRIVAFVCALGLSAGLGLVPGSAQAKSSKAKVQHLQVLAFNDLHGNLEPPTGSGGRVTDQPDGTTAIDAGGVEYLATHLRDRPRKGHQYSITVRRRRPGRRQPADLRRSSTTSRRSRR